MSIEIERKFLLKNQSWKQQIDDSVYFKQGYLNSDQRSSVRIRIEGEQANINIKSGTLGVFRMEYEYPIPIDDAHELLNSLCHQPLIEKTRHYIKAGPHKWEIDEFCGENEGLVVAEIELSDEQESFDKPDWLGKEVSEDKRYYNSMLVKHPFKQW